MGLFSRIKQLILGRKPEKVADKRAMINEKWESSAHLLDIDEGTIEPEVEISADKSRLDNIRETAAYKKTSETLDKVGDVILDTGEKFMGKSKEFIDGPGRKVVDKFGEASEKIGEKIVKGGKAVYDKASDALNDLGEKLDEKVREAEEFAKSEKEDKSEFADTDFRLKDTGSNDDFFGKADRFSRGDFSDFPETKIIPPEKAKKEPKTGIEGFEDRDHDGDPLIDDARIVEEE
jgi:hypothetical protein